MELEKYDMESKKYGKERSSKEKVCFNCLTTETPLWRRSKKGANLCNACGLYYRNHGEHRPMNKSMIYQNQTISDHYSKNLDFLEKMAVSVLADMKLKASSLRHFEKKDKTVKNENTVNKEKIYYNNTIKIGGFHPLYREQYKGQSVPAKATKVTDIKKRDTKAIETINNATAINKTTVIVDTRRNGDKPSNIMMEISRGMTGVVFGDYMKRQNSIIGGNRNAIPVIKDYWSTEEYGQKDVTEAVDKLASLTEQ